MFVDPVGARGGTGETGCRAIACGINAILLEEVDFGNDAGHVDTTKVAGAATVIRRG